MRYKGVEIRKRESGTYELYSPINNKIRIFKTKERVKYYIDNANELEEMAKALN